MFALYLKIVYVINMTTPTPLKTKVKKVFKSQKRLAESLGVEPMTVCQWFRPGRRIPAEYCLAIHRLSEGAIALSELRPDLYPTDSSQHAA